VRYRNTRQAAHSYSIPPSPYTSLAHTAHTYQFPSSVWASALDCYMVSALGSRLGWTPAGKERTNERMTCTRNIKLTTELNDKQCTNV